MSLNGRLTLPTVFGRYILLRRISRGGMGEIFLGKLGEIQGFEKPIVIKKILPDLAQDKEFLQRFVEEAQIAIKLTHANIVPVYEVGMVDGEYFLALQYVEGRDLRSLTTRFRERKQRMPPDLCLFLVREITNGLAYAHRRTDEAGQPMDLVHCDISPPNILVSWEGEVKIIDFGIAKSAIQKAQADETVGFGKFGYMAPEQLLRGAVVDRRTDIYSTGVLLFELLTGDRLFNFPPGTDYRRVARDVTAGKIDPPSDRDLNLTDRFDNLVLRALRTSQDERYQSAEEFRDEVQQHLYAMNPTISADTLAAFMRELFAEEIEDDRQMLRSLSQTDMEPFRTELSDGTSHTVSYALAELWTAGGQPALAPGAARNGGPAEAVVVAPAAQRAAEVEQRPTGERSVRSYTVMVQQRRRTYLLLGATLAFLVAVGVVLGLVLRGQPEPAATRVVDASPKLAVRVRISADSAASPTGAATPDKGVHLTFAPDPVHHSEPDAGGPDLLAAPAPKKVIVKRRPYKRRRPRPSGHRKAKAKQVAKPRPISSAMVQKKFTQVRREYSSFKKSYGHLLDSEWQKILFANTYGNMDENRYLRLDAMLDDLRQRMKRVKERGE
jgi:serine/threonine protein kinase